MEDNQIHAQTQKEYYERAEIASEKLRLAKEALMDSTQPKYEEALSLLDEGLGVSRGGTTGDELMVRQNLACVSHRPTSMCCC